MYIVQFVYIAIDFTSHQNSIIVDADGGSHAIITLACTFCNERVTTIDHMNYAP